jgi:hypothetical protein
MAEDKDRTREDAEREAEAASAQAAADFEMWSILRREHGWPPWTSTFLVAYSQLPNQKEAAQKAGVSTSTVSDLARRSEPFMQARDAARDIGLDRLEATAYLRSTVGTPMLKRVVRTRTYKDGNVERIVEETTERHVSDILLMFTLKRWRPEYRERYGIEQSGPDGGPITYAHEEKVDEAVKLFDAEVVRLADRRAAGGDPGQGRG